MTTGVRRPGVVITFYSYKGGTGRSMALANAACVLAEDRRDPRGILMIDWDLEAPGLHRYFESRLPAGDPPGLIELLCELQDAVFADRTEAFFDSFDSLLARFALPIETQPSLGLSMIKSGRPRHDYASIVSKFDWEGLFQRDSTIFTRLAAELAARYRYVLIDSRTGISDLSGICSMLMPEKLVVVFTPNLQSLDGVLDVARRAIDYRKDSADLRPLTVFPLASRIDGQDSRQRTTWRTGGLVASDLRVEGYQPQFERLFTEIYGLEGCQLNRYFDDVQIQHDTFFAYGERVAMLEPVTADRLSLADSYRHFARYLCRDEPPWSGDRQISAILERYRARRAGSFERWDLRATGPMPTIGNRPVEILLDDMYIPLRVASELDSSRLDRSVSIHPEDLLEPCQPRVLIGEVGTGKTTWMKWTFRRLIQEPRAVPFFLELHAIAASWKTHQEAARPIETYLADQLAESGASDPNAAVSALLTDTAGPRPVVLIDGWDQIDARGEHLRERLVEFCRAFPRVVVVVSSRPYGETRPAGVEGFGTVFIQPLSDSDIRDLATRFHRRLHGLDESAALRAMDAFMAALTERPEVRALAGSALLLTMMLLLSREGPLPDRRHKVYSAGVRNMLLHRVNLRERDGESADLTHQWRPDDGGERLRAAAELAYRMQAEGYQNSRRALIVTTWDHAIGLLETSWSRDQREAFLFWLVQSAGILIDRADGSIHFTHLSFQEFLTAYYLFVTLEGDERVATVRSYMRERDWWETLRLWAALLDDQWPDRLGPVLSMLQADADTYWLAGQMFADGIGRPSLFDAWLVELPAHLSDPFTSGEDCALAWGACKQVVRRAAIASMLASRRGNLRWLDAAWHLRWCDLAKLDVQPAPALLALEAPIDSPAATARSRVLHGAAPSWPDGEGLAMLRLWPSRRLPIGVRLQAAISLGARAPEVQALLAPVLAQASRSWSVDHHTHAPGFTQQVTKGFARAFSRDLVRHLIQYFGWDVARYMFLISASDSIRLFFRGFVQFVTVVHPGFARIFDDGFVRTFAGGFVRDFAGGFARDLSRYFNWGVGFPETIVTAPWLPSFAALELSSIVGRASPRAVLAYEDIPDEVPLLALFRAACRASFAPGDTAWRELVVRACAAFDGDSLWPALARHVARISTSDDRALLADLAQHPEGREPPLSWGLQHYVRGDLVLDDGSVITLDELCAQAGLAPLPFLEDMPDEIDIAYA